MVIARGEKTIPPEHTTPDGVSVKNRKSYFFSADLDFSAVFSFARSALSHQLSVIQF
jgi:hypothetical protein